MKEKVTKMVMVYIFIFVFLNFKLFSNLDRHFEIGEDDQEGHE